MPRTDKYKDILNNKQMPNTNESCVVIPCLTKTYGFKTNQFKLNQKYLRDMISEEDFNSFVRRGTFPLPSEHNNREGTHKQVGPGGRTLLQVHLSAAQNFDRPIGHRPHSDGCDYLCHNSESLVGGD